MGFDVLVIDDDKTWLDKFAFLIRQCGHTADLAGDIQTAQERIEGKAYDLILIDLCLDGDSYSPESQEFIQWLIAAYPRIPKLITTGQDVPDNAIFDLGRQSRDLLDFISKRTLDLDDFRTKVDDLLQKRRSLKMLHLSDFHLSSPEDVPKYLLQLETDMNKNLKIERLDLFVLTGDLADRATQEEFDSAFTLVSGIMERFSLEAGQVIVVPGNHDLNWDVGERAYSFVPQPKVPARLKEGSYVEAGERGILLRDDRKFMKRFDLFNRYFYHKLYASSYPLEYQDQIVVAHFPKYELLIMGLNSAWEIDKYFPTRAGINMQALTHALADAGKREYDSWLKIAAWHHPVTGREMMKDDFLQLLSEHNFQICLHGHMHEELEGFYKYDDARGLHLVGAGTFGAPVKQQQPGIPLQYNLLVLDRAQGKLTVHTRKKEKPDGAFSADARWGNKNAPRPWYEKDIKW